MVPTPEPQPGSIFGHRGTPSTYPTMHELASRHADYAVGEQSRVYNGKWSGNLRTLHLPREREGFMFSSAMFQLSGRNHSKTPGQTLKRTWTPLLPMPDGAGLELVLSFATAPLPFRTQAPGSGSAAAIRRDLGRRKGPTPSLSLCRTPSPFHGEGRPGTRPSDACPADSLAQSEPCAGSWGSSSASSSRRTGQRRAESSR